MEFQLMFCIDFTFATPLLSLTPIFHPLLFCLELPEFALTVLGGLSSLGDINFLAVLGFRQMIGKSS